jgi:hypothetical protein
VRRRAQLDKPIRFAGWTTTFELTAEGWSVLVNRANHLAVDRLQGDAVPIDHAHVRTMFLPPYECLSFANLKFCSSKACVVTSCNMHIVLCRRMATRATGKARRYVRQG